MSLRTQKVKLRRREFLCEPCDIACSHFSSVTVFTWVTKFQWRFRATVIDQALRQPIPSFGGCFIFIPQEDLVEDFVGGEEKARSGQGLQPVFISTSQSMVQQRDHPLETLQTTGTAAFVETPLDPYWETAQNKVFICRMSPVLEEVRGQQASGDNSVVF